MVIWAPNYRCHIYLFYWTRSKKFFYFRVAWITQIKINYSSHLREETRLSFVGKLIQCDICFSKLLSNISLNVPCRYTRHYLPCRLSHCRTNCELHNPFRTLCRMFNNKLIFLMPPYILMKLVKTLNTISFVSILFIIVYGIKLFVYKAGFI